MVPNTALSHLYNKSTGDGLEWPLCFTINAAAKIISINGSSTPYVLLEKSVLHLGQVIVILPLPFGSLKSTLQVGHLKYV